MADNNPDAHDAEKEARREKHRKRMNKILFKAWNLPNAEPFQESPHSSASDPRDLTTIGQSLDGEIYMHGRHGWEKFATDMGCVYTRHMVRKGKHSSIAKKHLNEVIKFFSKVDPILGDIVSKAVPPEGSTGSHHAHSSGHAKRKAQDQDQQASSEGAVEHHVPKKKIATGSASTGSDTLTLSQREKKAMDALGTYLEECGGTRDQSNNFRCKVCQRPGGRYDTVFFSSEGRRLKSMIDVARFLSLVAENKVSSSQKGKGSGRAVAASGKPRNNRECEAERKKLRRELDKLLKAHGKATKALDDFRNEQEGSRYPIDDDILMEKEKKGEAENAPSSNQIVCKPDIDRFPGFPAHSTPDLLMVWDFLCTFSRALSLEPIALDDFVASLIFCPGSGSSGTAQQPGSCSHSFPVYVAEAHLALLKLLLQDQKSDDWWWSTLETDEAVDGGEEEDPNATEKKRKRGSDVEEQLTPVIKVDLAALLAIEEDPNLTTRWLQALEDVRARKTNSGGPIKSAVKSALAVTTNQFVKSYLKKSMRKWRGNSAGFTKRAVVWLVDRVREARPDLWGRKVSEEEVNEQKNKVAREAALVMEKVNEEVFVDNENEMNLEGDSDEYSESEDEDDFDDNDDDFADQAEAMSTNSLLDATKSSAEEKKDDSEIPVTSPVPTKPPPSLVDLLLPPAKPLPASDLVSPFTWPCIAGATACRVLHRYKRRRNEVDDSLRESRELPPMSVAERRRRESMATSRILSECAASASEGGNTIESAIDFLCRGGSYFETSPLQRLCILRLLIEAAYDTNRVKECVEDNFKARINAVKALENEERRAKREARQEAADAEATARERLASETRAEFISKKRREIAQSNETTNEFTDEFIEGLTDEDVAEFDEETKAEYEALPAPENFNKTEVNAMVARIHEEVAFNTHSLLVLTMDEIQAREERALNSMQERLAAFGDVNTIYQRHSTDRETSAKVDRLQREISTFTQMILSLPPVRSLAVEALKDAIEDGTVKALRAAIKSAKMARLSGVDEDTKGVWALDLLRDAALELRNAERRKRVTEAQKDLVAKRNKCFIRTDPLGRDRHRNNYYHFVYDETGRVWVERDYIIRNSLEQSGHGAETSLLLEASSVSIGATDQEEDLIGQEISSSNEDMERFLRFSRQEYHPSALISTLAKQFWCCHATDQSLRSLLKNLDGRGVRESELKAALKETLEAIGVSSPGAEATAEQSEDQQSFGSPAGIDTSQTEGAPADPEKKGVHDNRATYQTIGDEDAFLKEKHLLESNSRVYGEASLDMLNRISSAIGKRLRLRRIPDPITAPLAAKYDMGTVTGWKMQESRKQNDDTTVDGAVGESVEAKTIPVWRLSLDIGGEVQITGTELLDGLTRAVKWTTQHQGYVEHDAPFLSYRNGFGRFCGRAADAPTSSSPMTFAKHMLKRESEFYTPLKNRSYENNWGGKSGARNAWILSIKEYGHDFEAVRNGLLTLEEAIFELSGGFSDDITQSDVAVVAERKEDPNGKELLNDMTFRFDIELESIGNVVTLWNCRESRAIFKELVQSCSTIAVLALSLDLMCRNCSAYLVATKPAATQTRNSVIGLSMGTRRMNAWQQANSVFAEQPIGTRRMNAWQQANLY